jgi:hypothetical protein
LGRESISLKEIDMNMDFKRKLQLRILLLIIKMIDGIHLKDELRDEINALTKLIMMEQD